MILYCLLTIGDVQGQCLDLTAHPDGGYIVLQYFVDNILRFGLVYWVFGIWHCRQYFGVWVGSKFSFSFI